MTVTLASCTARPSRADIDPLLTAFYEELRPRVAALGYAALDIPLWIEDFSGSTLESSFHLTAAHGSHGTRPGGRLVGAPRGASGPTRAR